MKLILFGIAIMLFGWIIETSFHFEFAIIAAAIGLVFAIVGLVSKNK